jgi:hypothetical protein
LTIPVRFADRLLGPSTGVAPWLATTAPQGTTTTTIAELLYSITAARDLTCGQSIRARIVTGKAKKIAEYAVLGSKRIQVSYIQQDRETNVFLLILKDLH